MNIVYIIFKDSMSISDKDKFQEIVKKYSSLFEIVMIEHGLYEPKKDSYITIVYHNKRGKWIYEYQNGEVLIINNLNKVYEILEFYSKYDYDTLSKLKGAG